MKKNKYGGFLLAAAAYISGILLFSFWSYSAHQNTLLGQMDKTLLDAAFTMQEILDTDFAATLSTGIATNPAMLSIKQQNLARLANHGTFNFVEVASVRNETVITLIIGSNTNQTLTVQEQRPLAPDIEKMLIELAASGNDDTHLFSAKHPSREELRYAVLYKADEKGNGIAYLAAQDCQFIDQKLTDQAVRLLVAGLGMLILAIPLILFSCRIQKKATKELSDMNLRLQHDVDLQQSREKELKDAINDLQRFTAVASGREMRIIELKAEVNELLKKSNCEKRYTIDCFD